MPDIRDQVVKAYESTTKADQSKVDAILRAISTDGFAIILDDDSDIGDLLEQVARDGGAQAMMQIGLDDSDVTKQVSREAQAYARERSAELVGKKIVDDVIIDNPNAMWSISEGTRELLRGTVSSAIDEGLSPAQLARNIENSYAFSRSRADMIARTEIAFADAAGNMAAYRESNIVKGKAWILGPNSCDVCVGNAEAGVIDIDASFPSGDDTAPAHPHCECDVIPILDEDEQ